MRNLFVKTYVAFAALILVSFTFAGSVFLAQISRYSVQQNKSQLENSVSNIQALVEHNESAYVDTDGRSILQLYLQQMAVSSNSQMMVADAEGHVLISASGEKTAGDLKADDRFGRMVVSGEKAIIDIVKPLDGSTIEIVSKEKKPSVPVTKYAEFPYEHDFILFQNIRTSHGTIKIVGAIQRV